MLLRLLGRLALAGFVRCRVVDLADVVGLDRKRLVLHAVSRVRLWLDLAFNDDRRSGLEAGGELCQRPPNLNLEPIGILVLGAVLVFPLLVDGNAEVDYIAVGGGLLFGVFAEVAFEVDVVFVAGHDVLLVYLVASESGHTAGTDMGRSELPSAKQILLRRGTTACLGRGIRKAQRKVCAVPQGESVLDASMMADLIVSKKGDRVLAQTSPPQPRAPGR